MLGLKQLASIHKFLDSEVEMWTMSLFLDHTRCLQNFQFSKQIIIRDVPRYNNPTILLIFFFYKATQLVGLETLSIVFYFT